MKRCPQCNRVEPDEALKFCRVDGATLVNDSSSIGGEVGTARFDSQLDAGEVHTSILPHTTDAVASRPTGPTTSLPSAQSAGVTEQLAKKRKPTVLIAVAALVLVFAVVAGYFIARGYRWGNSASSIESIAVLPFVNATGNAETEFLSDGISETLINNFTRIPTLRVTARSTAFRYKGKDIEPQKIGSELGVGSVLTGRVLQRGDALTIQVDLVNTSDGVQIWGNRYEGNPADIVSIQQRIASDVSTQLKLKLTGAQQQQIAKTYTQNPEAYQHYLRGRFYWNKRTEDSIKKALEEFQAAANADPLYALAYVGLGDSYLLLPEYAGTPVNEVMPKAKAFAEKALQIEPSLGESHATLGLVNHYLWLWEEADLEFQRAIELNPNYPTLHHWYSNTLRESGDYKQAMAEISRAHELDPLSGIINVNVGIMLWLNGDTPGARVQFRRTMEMDPSWFNAYFHMGLIDLVDGRIAESIPNLQKSVELNPSALRPVGTLGYSLAVVGRRAEALELLKKLEARYAMGVSTASNIATIYIGLGEKDKAYDWLEKGFEDKDIEITRSHWLPQFNSIRGEARFKELMQRIRRPNVK